MNFGVFCGWFRGFFVGWGAKAARCAVVLVKGVCSRGFVLLCRFTVK
jgi:hypothetical protein